MIEYSRSVGKSYLMSAPKIGKFRGGAAASKLILFCERPLSRTLAEFSAHYHGERHHADPATIHGPLPGFQPG